MSNYTNENLISIPSSSVPAGTLAMKVGNNVFTAGNVVIGGATDYYKCATVGSYIVSGAGESSINGIYLDTGITWNNHPVYSLDSSEGICFLYYSADRWFISLDYENVSDPLGALYTNVGDDPTLGWGVGGIGSEPAPTVTGGNHTWTGYKAVFDSVTGIYGYEVTATTGLTYSLVTPVVGRVYADGALIEAKLWEGILLPDSPFAYGYPDPTWTSGQKLSSWGTFTQSDSTKQFEIATINGVTGLQNAAGMSMTAPSAITGNFSFCVKAYIAPDAALSGSCPLLDTNSWGGALFALWANSDSGTYPMLSMRGYSFEAYSAPDMSNVSGVHTLVMTYNTDGTTKLYFDNVLAASEYYDPGFDHSQTLYLLGDTANVLTLGVAAYNRELTPAEAASIIW